MSPTTGWNTNGKRDFVPHFQRALWYILHATTCNSKCKMRWWRRRKWRSFCCTQYYAGLIWLNLCGTTTIFGVNLYRCLFAIIAVEQMNKFSCFSATLIFRSPEQLQTKSMFNGFSFWVDCTLAGPLSPFTLNISLLSVFSIQDLYL